MSAPPPPSNVVAPQSTTAGGSPGGPPLSSAATNPLTLRVSVLRKPEVYFDCKCDPELSEDGDILHDVLSPPVATGVDGTPHASASMLGWSPVLTFPNRGPHFVGEYFRALMSFRNQNATPLARLFFRIEMVTPQSQRVVLFDKEVPKMEGQRNRDVRVEHRLLDVGKYTLSVSVSFSDSVTMESRRFSWSSAFDVSRGVVEAGRKLYVLPPHPTMIADIRRSAVSSNLWSQPASDCAQQKEGDGEESTATIESRVRQKVLLHAALQSLQSPRICVAITLQNNSDVPLMLTSVRLVPKDGQYQLLSAGNSPQQQAATTFAHQYCGGGRDALEDGHFAAKDTRQYLFEVAPVLPKASLPVAAAVGSSSSGGGAFFSSSGSGSVASVQSTKALEIGHVEWEWRRSSGDGGLDMSGILRLSKSPPRLADVDLYCVGVAHREDGSFQASAGVPCELLLVVVNRTTVRKDISLHVNALKMLPLVAYSGPTVRPLGFVEGQGELFCTLPIVPLVSGVWAFAGCVELRDARSPNVVVWPLKQANTVVAPPPLTQSSSLLSGGAASPTGHQPLSSSLSLPTESWPPKLCDIFVN